MRQRHITSLRGFTLLEILVAMSLFTLIGFSVVLLMTSGVDMWLQGTRG
ncbi:MAG: prepilin-type N-terminal cleavage/methylation domain-containing protein, partial [Planctomycetota bacterium]